jgi:DNA repair protein RecO (recombination protein O)
MLSIVLARRDFREYDQTVTLLSAERGKVELLAKGVKKIVSKNTSHLEPGSLVIVKSVRGRELEHLTTAQPAAVFPRTRRSIEKLLALRVAMAFLDRLVHPGERDAAFFRTVVRWITMIEKTEHFSPILLDGFFVACLKALGLAPRLSACVMCNAPFGRMAFEKPALYFAGGGIICPPCRVNKPPPLGGVPSKAGEAVGEEMRECTLADVSNLQLLAKSDWQLLERYPLPPDEAARLHALVYAFTIYHSERTLADWGNLWYTIGSMKQVTANNNT